MWESIDNGQQSKYDLSWLVEGMNPRMARTTGNGQQIYVELDGSYFAAKQEHV